MTCSVVPSLQTGTFYPETVPERHTDPPIHSSAAESLSFDAQEAEENFDLAVIASLEIDVVSHLGDSRVPDYLISHLAKVLQQGSQLRHDEDEDELVTPPQSAKNEDWSDLDKADRMTGSVRNAAGVFRERFSYWCFDLLFLICSDTSKGKCFILEA